MFSQLQLCQSRDYQQPDRKAVDPLVDLHNRGTRLRVAMVFPSLKKHRLKFF